MVGLGTIRTICAPKDVVMDMAPGDLLANFIVSAIALLQGPDVINFSTCSRNPITISQFLDYCNSYF